MRKTWFTSGDWNAICDVCGFKYKASELTERWDGLKVCSKDWETRHPQELIRPIPDQKPLPWTRPESRDITIPFGTFAPPCTFQSSQGVADQGAADCARAEVNFTSVTT